MSTVFIVSEEWMLRAGVRAELRERGIKTLGMESAEDVASAMANGKVPHALVIDGNAKAASDPAVQQLARRVPAIVIAPRTETIALGPAAKSALPTDSNQRSRCGSAGLAERQKRVKCCFCPD